MVIKASREKCLFSLEGVHSCWPGSGSPPINRIKKRLTRTITVICLKKQTNKNKWSEREFARVKIKGREVTASNSSSHVWYTRPWEALNRTSQGDLIPSRGKSGKSLRLNFHQSSLISITPRWYKDASLCFLSNPKLSLYQNVRHPK